MDGRVPGVSLDVYHTGYWSISNDNEVIDEDSEDTKAENNNNEDRRKPDVSVTPASLEVDKNSADCGDAKFLVDILGEGTFSQMCRDLYKSKLVNESKKHTNESQRVSSQARTNAPSQFSSSSETAGSSRNMPNGGQVSENATKPSAIFFVREDYQDPDTGQSIGQSVRHEVTGRKMYECYECSKRFKDKGHLVVHVRSHTGVKPHKCSHCDYASSTEWNLKAHMRRHSGEKPWKCNHCDISFADSKSLKAHVQKHLQREVPKPHKCSLCHASFTSIITLTLHMRKHAGEKQHHVCDKCKKIFPYKEALTLHACRPLHFIDAGAKFGIYKCSHGCSLKFKSASELEYHKKHAHSSIKFNTSAKTNKNISQAGRSRDSGQASSSSKLRCPMCPFISRHESFLTRHVERWHMDGKPCACIACLKPTTKQPLENHE